MRILQHLTLVINVLRPFGMEPSLPRTQTRNTDVILFYLFETANHFSTTQTMCLIQIIKAKGIKKKYIWWKWNRVEIKSVCVCFTTGTEHTLTGLHGKYTAPHNLLLISALLCICSVDSRWDALSLASGVALETQEKEILCVNWRISPVVSFESRRVNLSAGRLHLPILPSRPGDAHTHTHTVGECRCSGRWLDKTNIWSSELLSDTIPHCHRHRDKWCRMV